VELFDFSKLQNTRQAAFSVRWLWIPPALSTLGPASSPRLSTIRLNFASHSATNQSAKTLFNDVGGGLRLVADEFARIERRFGGAGKLAVARDSVFKVGWICLVQGFVFVE